ncbi:hypothetical protein [Ornithinimicrobium murale]|uniref:hypothetical protein n=1 Tax=Ornithinimicrobium murale TaxID=1050153 RepID=UPI000E0D5507|nr:hypothetical protein [Ornithinimicrobium murale]
MSFVAALVVTSAVVLVCIALAVSSVATGILVPALLLGPAVLAPGAGLTVLRFGILPMIAVSRL